MGRWVPDAKGRLVAAALDLYDENGFDRTTVAEIADRAGVTERTFFRHFADKREVLFAGGQELEARMVEGIAGAPADLSALDAAVGGLAEAFSGLEQPWARRRSAIVTATPALRERELLKMASLGSAAATALRERGVAPLAAALAAESAVAVFRTAFEQWIRAEETADLPALMRSVLAELRETIR